MISFTIQKVENIGLRLDKFLVTQMPDHSRSRIQHWIKDGNILVNGLNRKTGYSLELNDEIKVIPPEIESSNPDLIPEKMGNLVKKFKEAGATILGGCCETTPQHIREMSRHK